MKHRHLVAVLILAPAMGTAAPVIAQDSAGCTAWTVGMVDDEGGQVLTAQACAVERPDVYITMTCGNGTASLRFDLAAGGEVAPQPSEVTDVTFETTTDKVTLQMGYEEYDGYFAAYPRPDDPLVQLLKAGDTLTVRDVPGRYPTKHFSLRGSSAALGKLVANCD